MPLGERNDFELFHMTPLARWTIGGCSNLGFETLFASIKRFRLLYPEFDLIVCCNWLRDEQRERLERLSEPKYYQTVFDLEYPLEAPDGPLGVKGSMPGWGWKLCPPRLRPDAHELWIDNDIIIRERLPTVDAWLASDKAIISQGRYRAYGAFDDVIGDCTLCAGFFGLPPGFDFKTPLLAACHTLGRPFGHYDEQGAVVSIVEKLGYYMVPDAELTMVKSLPEPLSPGLHFIGVNRTGLHEAWELYKQRILTHA